MSWFRHREEETYNEQLLREAGLDRPQDPQEPEQAPDPPAQSSFASYTRAMARSSEWDVFATVQVPELAGDGVEFAALPEGDLIVDEEQGDADLSPLADAVERQLTPPYRAVARRQEGALWAVAAHTIDVRRLESEEGDELDLVVRGGDPRFPDLDPDGEYVVHGARLDGDLWEIRIEVL